MQTDTTGKPLITAKAVALRLSVTHWRVYELAHAGSLPFVQLGRSMRFDPDAIEQFIASGGTRADGPRTDTAA